MKRLRHHVNPLCVRKEYSFLGFGNNKPVIVDIGSCRGGFVEQLANKFPEKNYLACEIRTLAANALKKKFAEDKNIVVFDGDAGRNFERLLAPCISQGATIDTVYINFPDPWFKARHKKRRFINAQFLQDISTWFPKDTWIVFQTDQEHLFNETMEEIEASPVQTIERFETSPHGIQTWWEEKKSKNGEPIWRVRFKFGS